MCNIFNLTGKWYWQLSRSISARVHIKLLSFQKAQSLSMEAPPNPPLCRMAQSSLLLQQWPQADLIALLPIPQQAQFSPDPAGNLFPLPLIFKSGPTVMLCAAPCLALVNPLKEIFQTVEQSPLATPAARSQPVKLSWNLRMLSSRLSSMISKHLTMSYPMSYPLSSPFFSPCQCQECPLPPHQFLSPLCLPQHPCPCPPKPRCTLLIPTCFHSSSNLPHHQPILVLVSQLLPPTQP